MAAVVDRDAAGNRETERLLLAQPGGFEGDLARGARRASLTFPSSNQYAA